MKKEEKPVSFFSKGSNKLQSPRICARDDNKDYHDYIELESQNIVDI